MVHGSNRKDQTMPKFRTIDLDIDIGSEAIDYEKMQAAEKLKPLELEMRRIEGLVADITADLDYLKSREQRMRDTNESTNYRVKISAILSMLVLGGVGVWQIVYLRNFFKR